jgi:ATP-dependent helicase HrpB
MRLVSKPAQRTSNAGDSAAGESDIDQREQAFLGSLFSAYPDRLARRRDSGSRRGVMVGGRGVRLADEVALRDEELFLCIDVDGAGGEALVRQASAVDRAWLPAERVTTETVVEFDEIAGRVTALRCAIFDGLVLEETQASLPDGELVAAALAPAAASRLQRVFPADDEAVSSFRARAQCLASWMPELGLPNLDDEALRDLLPQLAAGRRSLAEIRSAPWLAAMKGLYEWDQLRAIDQQAPERIEVPSGNQIRLQYEPGRPPILAVRIQELFGLLETPRIAGGRVRVLVHLLAPNMRVAQVTDDLASFWANTYTLVRKDLRARYPKHAWPEDPYTATAQRRPTRKK